MNIQLPTTEKQGGANSLSAPGPRTLEGETVRQEDRADVVNREPGDAALPEALEIARTELARRRRGLGLGDDLDRGLGRGLDDGLTRAA